MPWGQCYQIYVRNLQTTGRNCLAKTIHRAKKNAKIRNLRGDSRTLIDNIVFKFKLAWHCYGLKRCLQIF